MKKAVYDYSALLGRMVAAGYNRQTFAKALGISQNSMSNKLASKFPFKVDEIAKACSLLDIASSEIGHYFFAE